MKKKTVNSNYSIRRPFEPQQLLLDINLTFILPNLEYLEHFSAVESFPHCLGIIIVRAL